MHENDDELAGLLADEDRVREALLAAVDQQLVPPVRTDLADIVHRGKRRARLQVVGASVAAVVLIAAVTIGATMIGRLGGPQRVSAADGPSTSLPVTSQTLSTTPNPTTSAVPRSDAAEGPCIYPGLAGSSKWAQLNAKQTGVFLNAIHGLGYADAKPLTQAVPGALDVDQDAAMSVAIVSHGQVDLVSVSATYYDGPAALAAHADSAQANMPAICTGLFVGRPLGKAPLINEYESKEPSAGSSTMFLHVQSYSDKGIRYDVTEALDATGLAAQATPVTGTTTPASSGSTYRIGLPPPLSMAQLVSLAVEMATFG